MNHPPLITSSRWGARTKRIVVLICLIGVVFILWNVLNLLPTLIVAALLSYLLWPLVNIIDLVFRGTLRFWSRSLSVLLAFAGVISLFVLIVILIVPVLADRIEDAGRALPEFFESVEAEVLRVLNQPLMIGGRPLLLDGEPIVPLQRLEELTGQEELSSAVQLENFDLVGTIGTFVGSLGVLTGPAFTVLGRFLTALINTVFLLVIMFYFMRDGDQFIDQLINLTPASYQGDVRRLIYELGKVWNAYLRGQLILCMIVGFAVYLASVILGLPNAPVLGLVAGILEFIPNLGPFLALIPAFFTALFSDSSTLPFLGGLPLALIVVAVWIGIQNIEAIFLVPRVMGGSLNLHPVVVIIGVIAGASVAGPLGIVLAAPFIASIRVVGQYIYGKLFDLDPFPTPRRGEIHQGRVRRLQSAVGRRLAFIPNRLLFWNHVGSEGQVLPDPASSSRVSNQPDQEFPQL